MAKLFGTFFALIVFSFISTQASAQAPERAEKSTLEVSAGALALESGSNYFADDVVSKKTMPVAIFGASWKPGKTEIDGTFYFSNSLYEYGVTASLTRNNIFKLWFVHADAGFEYSYDSQSEQLLEDDVFKINGMRNRHYGEANLGLGLGKKNGNNFRVYFLAAGEFSRKEIAIYYEDKRFDQNNAGLVTEDVPLLLGAKITARYVLLNKVAFDLFAKRKEPYRFKYSDKLIKDKSFARLTVSCHVWKKFHASVTGTWSDDKSPISPLESKSVGAFLTYRIK
jgi:hypothetical protein